MPLRVLVGGIKTCQQCGGLYTGGTPLCGGCYFASLPIPTPPQVPRNRTERRALEKREAKAGGRASRTAQPPVRGVLAKDSRLDAHLPRTVQQNGIRPKQKKHLIQPTKRNLDAGYQPASPAMSVCYFCFRQIERDRMKTHLREVHGRDPYGAPLPQPDSQGSIFAFSGGLPSLGKSR